MLYRVISIITPIRVPSRVLITLLKDHLLTKRWFRFYLMDILGIEYNLYFLSAPRSSGRFPVPVKNL